MQARPPESKQGRGFAETVLENLQQVLREAAAKASSEGGRTPRDVERAYGTQATLFGRLLSDLTEGSYAWDVLEDMAFEHSVPDVPFLPRLGLVSQCEPLLQLMRESGELAARERLLRERDASLQALWLETNISDEARQERTDAVYGKYFDAAGRLAETFRAGYEARGRLSPDVLLSLVSPRVRSRPLLQPPLMALLFGACHAGQSGFDDAAAPDQREFRRGAHAVTLPAPELPLLDEMAWDIAALAVSAFLTRTSGTTIDSSFPLLFDDYFQWRGVDPRKRTVELRRQIDARLQLLCSDHMQVRSETSLWLSNSRSGRREKTVVSTEGPFLVKRSRLYRRPLPSDRPAPPLPDGYLLLLGDWARRLVEERAMRGVFVRRLAEYDLGRQQWERRIGWYLVFQMNNQASKMTFQDVTKDGKRQTAATPQHALKMKTVLAGSHVAWEDMARDNPGKVLRQWQDALQTLRKDGIIASCACLDGASDGSDLPTRGRLAAMLERRYLFTPGPHLLEHLRAKKNGARRKSCPDS